MVDDQPLSRRLASLWDRGFESCFLQRRVCEPSVPLLWTMVRVIAARRRGRGGLEVRLGPPAALRVSRRIGPSVGVQRRLASLISTTINVGPLAARDGL